jgi:hypothetical protein
MSPLVQRAATPTPVFRACAALLVAMALGWLPAVAQASDTAELKIAFSPDKLGAQISVHTDITLGSTDGSLPSPVIGFDLHLPPQLELIGSNLGLAICQPKALLAAGPSGCSPNARIGMGNATVAVPFGPEIARETASINILMGPPVGEQVGVLLYTESLTPVFAQLVFPAVLLIGSGPETLETVIPPTPTLPGAADATVTHMGLEIGPEHLTYYKRVHGKRVGYRPTGISLPSRCPRGGFLFMSNISFQDGTALRIPTAVPCPSSQRR